MRENDQQYCSFTGLLVFPVVFVNWYIIIGRGGRIGKKSKTGTLKICAIPTDLMDELKRFRFSKKRSTNALILKIDPVKQLIVLDQKLENCDADMICDELPVQQPRYIIISYERVHDDGRLSYPLCLVFYSPSGCNPQLRMMYAGSRNNLAKECGLNRNLEIREPDELTKELLESKL